MRIRDVAVGLVVLALSGQEVVAESRPRPPAARVIPRVPARERTAPHRAVPRRATLAARPVVTKPDTSATAVTTLYQRVGHALLVLQDLRGVSAVFELWPRFRAIKLDDALATVDTRRATLDELTALNVTIERGMGITLASACLANPLADTCR